MKFIILAFIFISVSSQSFGQSKNVQKEQISKSEWEKKQKEIQKSLRQQMNKQNEKLSDFMGSDSFKMYDQLMKEMLKSFEDSFKGMDWDSMDKEVLKDFNKIFKPGSRGFTNPLNPFNNQRLGQIHKWVETKKYRVLELHLNPQKDTPLDIKIEKGLVKVKGQFIIEKSEKTKNSKSYSKQLVSLDRQFTIPEDCIEEKVEFEHKKDKILIKFPKKS